MEKCINTEIGYIETAIHDYAGWYDLLARNIHALCDKNIIQCHQLDKNISGMFVTVGVKVYFNSKLLEIWSDDIGEIIIRSKNIGIGKHFLDILLSSINQS